MRTTSISFPYQSSVLTVWAGLFPVLGSAASRRALHQCSGADMTRYHKYRSLILGFAICTPDEFKLSCMVHSGVRRRQGLWFLPQVWPLPPSSRFWKNQLPSLDFHMGSPSWRHPGRQSCYLSNLCSLCPCRIFVAFFSAFKWLRESLGVYQNKPMRSAHFKVILPMILITQARSHLPDMLWCNTRQQSHASRSLLPLREHMPKHISPKGTFCHSLTLHGAETTC